MKLLRRLLIALLAIILILTIALVGWATVSAQDATARAIAVLAENGVERQDGRLVFRPDSPTNKGLIYYPGGLVEPEAYAVTAQGIADAGYLVVVPDMPLNLAFTGLNKADDIIEQFPEITAWVIGGHSLGGAMAASYAINNVEKLDGLIMYASYPASNEDFIDFPLPILCIVGSADPGAPNQEAFCETVGDETADLIIIDGANHRQYADYPFQNNDGTATISAADQQAQIIAATVDFLDSLE